MAPWTFAELFQYTSSAASSLCTSSFLGAREQMLHDDLSFLWLGISLFDLISCSELKIVVALSWFYRCETLQKIY